jgi:transmembrane sensor
MNTHHTIDKQPSPEELMIRDQAMDRLFWLNTAPEPNAPHRDLTERDAALCEWLGRSETHLRIFCELLKLKRRVCSLDATRIANIQRTIDEELMAQAHPRVDVLTDGASAIYGSDAVAGVVNFNLHPAVEVEARIGVSSPSVWRRPRLAAGIAAGVLAIALGSYFYFRPHVYTTQFGEQQQLRLSDGSFIDLNTDSEVAVNYSSDAREIRLLRGEAYFKVQHDPKRPFTVNSDDASVLAVGTEFDVRRSPDSTEVAVVVGHVQATALPPAGKSTTSAPETPGPPAKPGEAPQNPKVLSAGDMAAIGSGTVTKIPGGNVSDMVSWRQHRLDFHDARLAEVAAQFNRYNRSQIRVEGAAAQNTLVTATFKIRQIEDVIAFVRTREHLSMTQDGNDWVIRSRQ